MWVALSSVTAMIIDCDSCTVRGAACTDCVVTFLTIPVRPTGTAGPTPDGPGRGAPVATSSPGVDLDDDERAAIDVLASSGLVPPLRMVRAM